MRSLRPTGSILFCGDLHGSKKKLMEMVERCQPAATILVGDICAPERASVWLQEVMDTTELRWIPGNHDTDTLEYWENLFLDPVMAPLSLQGRTLSVQGLTIAGLGGVFRSEIWMPEDKPHHLSIEAYERFLKQHSPPRTHEKITPLKNSRLRRHLSSVFPEVYAALEKKHTDILVTHEASGEHHQGHMAFDRLATKMRAKYLVHGHIHKDFDYRHGHLTDKMHPFSVGGGLLLKTDGSMEFVSPKLY